MFNLRMFNTKAKPQELNNIPGVKDLNNDSAATISGGNSAPAPVTAVPFPIISLPPAPGTAVPLPASGIILPPLPIGPLPPFPSIASTLEFERFQPDPFGLYVAR